MQIVFTDPPKPARAASKYPWYEIAEQLRARPEEWALVLRGMNGAYSSAINRGGNKAFTPAGAYEARSVGTRAKDGTTTYDLYIRYLGETGEPLTEEKAPE